MCDLYAIADTLFPMTYVACRHRNALMESWDTEITSALRNYEKSGFNGVKCDTPGAKEVKQRDLRTGVIRPLTDSWGPLLFEVLFYMMPQKYLSGEVWNRGLFPISQISETPKLLVLGK